MSILQLKALLLHALNDFLERCFQLCVWVVCVVIYTREVMRAEIPQHLHLHILAPILTSSTFVVVMACVCCCVVSFFFSSFTSLLASINSVSGVKTNARQIDSSQSLNHIYRSRQEKDDAQTTHLNDHVHLEGHLLSSGLFLPLP